MHWRVVKLGKINKEEIRSLCSEYQKRLSPAGRFDILEVKDPGIQKPEEILKHCQIGPGNFVILLDERGHKFNSLSLAKFIQEKIESPSVKQITFLVGGSFGVGEEIRKSVNFIWSFSDLVFPNEIAWLLLWEQLYRSWCILTKNGYHHE
jgi:23S rRNA (pseudouridine1915-N3)-methyltransferase